MAKAYYGNCYKLSRKEEGKKEDRHCPIIRKLRSVLYHVTSETILGSARAQGGVWDRPHPSVCLRLMWPCGSLMFSRHCEVLTPNMATAVKTSGQKDRGVQLKGSESPHIGLWTVGRWFAEMIHWLRLNGLFSLPALLEKQVHISVYYQALYLRNPGFNFNNMDKKWIENHCLLLGN